LIPHKNHFLSSGQSVFCAVLNRAAAFAKDAVDQKGHDTCFCTRNYRGFRIIHLFLMLKKAYFSPKIERLDLVLTFQFCAEYKKQCKHIFKFFYLFFNGLLCQARLKDLQKKGVDSEFG
jgi:CRISPR/Cas system CSM-associated protein Csm4 (group 5 of RAMP superfamily)